MYIKNTIVKSNLELDLFILTTLNVYGLVNNQY